MGGKKFSLPVFRRKTSRKKGKKSEYMTLNRLNVVHKDLTVDDGNAFYLTFACLIMIRVLT